MFGYVRPPLESLPQPERDRFQRAYCGLCHTLGQRYGQAARFILNYDFTYLTILLASPTEGRRCRHGARSVPYAHGPIEKQMTPPPWRRMRA